MCGVWASGWYRSGWEGDKEPRDEVVLAAGRVGFCCRHRHVRAFRRDDVKLLAVPELDVDFAVLDEEDN